MNNIPFFYIQKKTVKVKIAVSQTFFAAAKTILHSKD